MGNGVHDDSDLHHRPDIALRNVDTRYTSQEALSQTSGKGSGIGRMLLPVLSHMGLAMLGIYKRRRPGSMCGLPSASPVPVIRVEEARHGIVRRYSAV